MKVLAKDLPSHLKRTLAPFYWIMGDEPLQHKEAEEAIRAAANTKGYTEREVFTINTQSEGEALLTSFNTQSLFAPKRLIEARFTESKIGSNLTELFTKLAKALPAPDILFLLTFPKIDKKLQKAAWFLALETKSCLIIARPLSAKETRLWLEQRLHTVGFEPTREIIDLLFERTEGNLLAAAQTIEKLKLYVGSKHLAKEDILQTVGIDTRFTLYDLVDAALAGNVAKTIQIFRNLKRDAIDPILINWIIAKEIRTILLRINAKPGSQQPYVFQHREFLVKTFITRFSAKKLQEILQKNKAIDDMLKGRAMGNVWDGLFTICLTLTGAYDG